MAQKLKPNDYVVSMSIVNENSKQFVLSVTVNGFGKSIIYLIKGHSGKIPISDIHYWG